MMRAPLCDTWLQSFKKSVACAKPPPIVSFGASSDKQWGAPRGTKWSSGLPPVRCTDGRGFRTTHLCNRRTADTRGPSKPEKGRAERVARISYLEYSSLSKPVSTSLDGARFRLGALADGTGSRTVGSCESSYTGLAPGSYLAAPYKHRLAETEVSDVNQANDP